MQLSKTVNLPQLEAELKAAGVSINALWTHGDPADEIGTYDKNGAEIDLPAKAGPVLNAHVAQAAADHTATADEQAFAAIQNAADLATLKSAILTWMTNRPGVTTP